MSESLYLECGLEDLVIASYFKKPALDNGVGKAFNIPLVF